MSEFAEAPIYAQLARVGRALSSPVRLRLLDLLDLRERTVEELAEQSGIGLKNTSAQLQHLRAAQLVTARRDGTKMHYRIADPAVSAFLGALQGFAEQRLGDLRQVIGEHLATPAMLTPVTADDLATRLGEPDLVVVDVRSWQEYASGHIPGAVWLPAADVERSLDRLPAGADIVAYCSGPYCVASPQVAQHLHEHGLRARPLDGGYTRWRRTHPDREESGIPNPE